MGRQRMKAPSRGGARRGSGAEAEPSMEERFRMIAEAAYYRAERRGFVGGDPTADWLAAEAEIRRQLAERR